MYRKCDPARPQLPTKVPVEIINAVECSSLNARHMSTQKKYAYRYKIKTYVN